MTDTITDTAADRRNAEAQQAAIELAYGLLWLAPTSNDQRLSLARQVLLEQLDLDGKLRGVHAAQDALAASRKNRH